MSDAAAPTATAPDWRSALAEFRALLGSANVLDDAAALAPYAANAGGLQRRITCVLVPPSTAAVPALIAVARRQGISLYPFSVRGCADAPADCHHPATHSPTARHHRRGNRHAYNPRSHSGLSKPLSRLASTLSIAASMAARSAGNRARSGR